MHPNPSEAVRCLRNGSTVIGTPYVRRESENGEVFFPLPLWKSTRRFLGRVPRMLDNSPIVDSMARHLQAVRETKKHPPPHNAKLIIFPHVSLSSSYYS